MNKDLRQLEKLFNIENFNIYSDDENYYFFRSLEEVDVESIKNKSIIDETGKIKRLITDREFYGETIFTKDSDISLEEITENIKKNYNYIFSAKQGIEELSFVEIKDNMKQLFVKNGLYEENN